MSEKDASSAPGADILIVEDSPTQAELLRFILERHGFRTDLAANGREALQSLARQRPRMIISDILMPEMDGYALCAAVKADEKLKDIPVMLLTALSDPSAVLKGLECGASGFFTKPYEEEYLLARVDYLLANRELRRATAPAAGLEVEFEGERFHVTAEPQQILDLLLSTYETAVHKNLDLIKAQEALRELNETLEQRVLDRTSDLARAEARLRQANRALRTISRCNEILVRANDEDTLLDRICQTIVATAGYRLAWVGYAEPDEAGTLRPVAKAGQEAGYLDSLEFTWRSPQPAVVPAACAIQTGKPCVVPDIQAEPASSWRDEASRQGYRSALALPLHINGRIIGALSIDSADPHAFSDEEVKLLSELASDLSYGIGALRARGERERAEKELILASKVFESSAEGIIITDFNRNIVSVNRAFTEVTGYSEDEVIGKNPGFLASGRHDREFYRGMWAAIEQAGHWAGEIWNRRKNGNIYPEWLDISAVKSDVGDTVSYVGIFSDISQRKELESTLQHLVQFDALTDLPNRLLLNDRLNSAISRARRANEKFAVFSINLDHFKIINDAFGFITGDAILVSVAQRLMAFMREGGTLSRIEQDNFIALVGPIEKEQDSAQIAQAMLDAIGKPYTVEGHDVRLTASIGISFYPANGETAPELLETADVALDRARELGRNTYRLFDKAMDERTHAEHVLEVDLHAALERNELRVHYQPQMDLFNGATIGLEALLRWQHPTLGLISPVRFIPIAEASGLIIPIGDWVLREACRQARIWQQEGFPELRLAVNVSALQMMKADFAQRVEQIIQETGFDPALLELELTESLFLKTTESTNANLHALRQKGIRFSIDDFGTGYAGFQFLQYVPVGKIKIDKSFVDNVTQNPNDAAIIQAITSMGRGLNLKVIAEGVEYEGQMKYLRSVHCDEIQGFHFSPPLPTENVLPFLNQTRLPSSFVAVAPGELRTLLLVDDEDMVLADLKRVFRTEGYRILAATSGEEALELLAQYPVGVILTDQRMPGMSGTELLSRVKLIYPNTVRIILSGYMEAGALAQAINTGEIYKFVEKSWENDDELREVVREAFIRYDTARAAPAGTSA
ncbi:MAG: response regulator receiver modulated diguanylate cyclase/phosphodiesterase with sensor(s) [Rhodocyclaceae bacterium]|nr:response regulator receiver modulated diguanylate cyclase/phosphodiesterase with sensor(s) [Rhodocyclaceae bacterium]